MTDEDEKAAFRDQQQHLKDLINQNITPCRGDDTEGVLAEQARLLDLAFRRFVSNAVFHENEGHKNFALGFRAQESCRHTLKFLNTLKNKKKDGYYHQTS